MSRPFAVLFALALLAIPGAAFAADCTTTTIADLEDEVMCSVCGTTIGLAREAPQAKRERAFIERMLASCRTKAQIKDALVVEFGPAVLAEPADEGFGAAAYAVPLLGGAAGMATVLLALLRWRRRSDPQRGPEPVAPLRRDETRKLEAELERLR